MILNQAFKKIFPEKSSAHESVAAAMVSPVTEEPMLSGKILLVEDHVVNRKLATRMLFKIGLETDIAVNGAKAIEMVQKNQYDLVLMDVQMPVLDGLQATSRIRMEVERDRRLSLLR